jgi:hypothetical protein
VGLQTKIRKGCSQSIRTQIENVVKHNTAQTPYKNRGKTKSLATGISLGTKSLVRWQGFLSGGSSQPTHQRRGLQISQLQTLLLAWWQTEVKRQQCFEGVSYP